MLNIESINIKFQESKGVGFRAGGMLPLENLENGCNLVTSVAFSAVNFLFRTIIFRFRFLKATLKQLKEIQSHPPPDKL